MADAGALKGTLKALYDDISDGAMAAENAAEFRTALIEFLASDKNLSGVKDINSTNLGNAGGTIKKVRIGTAEKLGTGAIICGITVALELPPGVTLKADLSVPTKVEKQLLSGVVKASGGSAGSYVKESYLPPSGGLPGLLTLSLASATGFAAGEFTTISCDVPAGVSVKAGDFRIYKNPVDAGDPRNFKAFDGNGVAFPADIITVEILPDEGD